MDKETKPIALAINDTRMALADTINNSGLPPCIVKSIVGDIYHEVSRLAEEELHNAMHDHDSGGE